MINRPEWFEMSTIDYFTIKGKVMFVVRLREHMLIGIACNVYRQLVSMRKSTIGKGKKVARLLNLLLNHRFTILYLVAKRLLIVGINHVMVHGVGTNDVPTFGQVL